MSIYDEPSISSTSASDENLNQYQPFDNDSDESETNIAIDQLENDNAELERRISVSMEQLDELRKEAESVHTEMKEMKSDLNGNGIDGGNLVESMLQTVERLVGDNDSESFLEAEKVIAEQKQRIIGLEAQIKELNQRAQPQNVKDTNLDDRDQLELLVAEHEEEIERYSQVVEEQNIELHKFRSEGKAVESNTIPESNGVARSDLVQSLDSESQLKSFKIREDEYRQEILQLKEERNNLLSEKKTLLLNEQKTLLLNEKKTLQEKLKLKDEEVHLTRINDTQQRVVEDNVLVRGNLISTRDKPSHKKQGHSMAEITAELMSVKKEMLEKDRIIEGLQMENQQKALSAMSDKVPQNMNDSSLSEFSDATEYTLEHLQENVWSVQAMKEERDIMMIDVETLEDKLEVERSLVAELKMFLYEQDDETEALRNEIKTLRDKMSDEYDAAQQLVEDSRISEESMRALTVEKLTSEVTKFIFGESGIKNQRRNSREMAHEIDRLQRELVDAQSANAQYQNIIADSMQMQSEYGEEVLEQQEVEIERDQLRHQLQVAQDSADLLREQKNKLEEELHEIKLEAELFATNAVAASRNLVQNMRESIQSLESTGKWQLESSQSREDEYRQSIVQLKQQVENQNEALHAISGKVSQNMKMNDDPKHDRVSVAPEYNNLVTIVNRVSQRFDLPLNIAPRDQKEHLDQLVQGLELMDGHSPEEDLRTIKSMMMALERAVAVVERKSTDLGDTTAMNKLERLRSEWQDIKNDKLTSSKNPEVRRACKSLFKQRDMSQTTVQQLNSILMENNQAMIDRDHELESLREALKRTKAELADYKESAEDTITESSSLKSQIPIHSRQYSNPFKSPEFERHETRHSINNLKMDIVRISDSLPANKENGGAHVLQSVMEELEAIQEENDMLIEKNRELEYTSAHVLHNVKENWHRMVEEREQEVDRLQAVADKQKKEKELEMEMLKQELQRERAKNEEYHEMALMMYKGGSRADDGDTRGGSEWADAETSMLQGHKESVHKGIVEPHIHFASFCNVVNLKSNLEEDQFTDPSNNLNDPPPVSDRLSTNESHGSHGTNQKMEEIKNKLDVVLQERDRLQKTLERIRKSALYKGRLSIDDLKMEIMNFVASPPRSRKLSGILGQMAEMKEENEILKEKQQLRRNSSFEARQSDNQVLVMTRRQREMMKEDHELDIAESQHIIKIMDCENNDLRDFVKVLLKALAKAYAHINDLDLEQDWYLRYGLLCSHR